MGNYYRYVNNQVDTTFRSPYDGIDLTRIASCDLIDSVSDFNYRLCDSNYSVLTHVLAATLARGNPTLSDCVFRLRGYDDTYDCNVSINWIRLRKYNSTNATWGTASAEHNASSIRMTSFYPTDGAVNLTTSGTNMTVTIESINGSKFNITWYSNSSGSWVAFGYNGSLGGLTNGSYDQTGTNFTDNTTRYYWNVSVSDSYTVFNSDIYSFTTGYSTTPSNPTNLSYVFHSTGALNITWDAAHNADTALVVRNNASYPSSRTDGWERYNGSNEYFNDTLVTEQCYFTLYSYNDTSKQYSGGVNLEWGGLGVSCFDEQNGTPIEFDIEITNEDASETYTADNITNVHFIDMEDIPYGDNTVFIVSSDIWGQYRERIYYYDLEQNVLYNFSFYLPYNVSYIHLYYLRVEDIGGNQSKGQM